MSNVPYQDIPTSQRVPSSSKVLELLGKSDLVKERYTTSTPPYAGANAGIGGSNNNRITWKIFNNADYADLSTAYITFNAKFTSSGGAANLYHLQAEDNVLSWFNLCRVLVNDQLLEEITNFNIFSNLITYSSMSKSFYESAGSFQGLYRHSTYLTGGPAGPIVTGPQGTPAALDFSGQNYGIQQWEQISPGVLWVPSAAAAAPIFGSGGNDTWASKNLQNTYGYNYAAPLAGYLGLFSINKFFPLRNVASITVEMNMNSNIASVVFDNLLPAAAAAPVATVSLALSNLYMHIDMVKLSDEYYSIMDQELVDPNGLGVQFVVNTVECTPVALPAAAGGATVKRTIVASKGTRFLKSVWMAQVPNFTINSSNCPPSSVFTNGGFQSAQLVVNSKRYPQLPIDNLPRAYEELSKSFGKYHSIIGDSIITYPKYELAVSAAGNLSSLLDSRAEYATFFLGFNLDQVLDAPEVDLQGENTLTAGFALQLELSASPLVDHTGFLFPHFSKVLRIKGGAVAILN